MPLELPSRLAAAIAQHGVRTYPCECCGLLLGRHEGALRVVVDAMPLRNADEDSPRNRFAFDPREHLRAQREARERGLETVGFYHSHPDHPARPSQFDLDQASWPGYSYYIVSIRALGAAAQAAEANSYELADDRSHFIQEDVIVREEPDGASMSI